MDFAKWAASKRLSETTIERLKEEELDCIDTLKSCSELDLRSLDLSKGQTIALRKAVAELLEGKSVEKDEISFEEWAATRNLKAETIDRLVSEELDDFETLKHIDDEELKCLKLKTGQLVNLKKAVAELKLGPSTDQTPKQNEEACTVQIGQEDMHKQHVLEDNEFTCWLKSKQLKQATIQQLFEMEFDSKEALEGMTEKNMQQLGVSPGQIGILRQLISKRKYTEEGDTASVPKDDKFREWLQSKQIKLATVEKLIAIEFDSEDVLMGMTEDDIKQLDISPGQSGMLRRVINEKKDEHGKQSKSKRQPDVLATDISLKDEKDDKFSNWLKSKQLKQATIEALYQLDFDCEEAFMHMTQEDISKIQITPGQRGILTKLVKEKHSDLMASSTASAVSMQQLPPSVSHDSSALPPKPSIDPPPPYSGPPSVTIKAHRAVVASPMQAATSQVNQPFRASKRHLVVNKHQPLGSYMPAANTQGTQAIHVPQRQPTPATFAGDSSEEMSGEDEDEQSAKSGDGMWSKLKKGAKKVAEKTGLATFTKYIGAIGKGSDSCEIEVINGMKVMSLPLKVEYENKAARVRVCCIGNPNLKQEQKTIMMVGATGAGKSTLIDGFCNYIFGVTWDEPTRFKLISEHPDEKKNKSKGQSESQTEWITVYRIASNKSDQKLDRVPFALNLIDTPGFGDTRGIKRDQELVDQIRALFGNPQEYKVDQLDAVCFLAKAPDARLTKTQKYIFDSILSIFGKNIAENILVMVTFADGAKSPVLDAIKASKMPHRKTFKFNNSALFANNGKTVGEVFDCDDDGSGFSEMFWKMGYGSLTAFFDFLKTLEPKSLKLTKEVLEQRKNLQDTLNYLEVKVHEGLAKMSELKAEEQLFQDYEDEIKRNKNFTYVVDEVRSKKIDCPANRHVTHCMNCHNTCHDNCIYKDDDDKANCCAMDSTGHCERCEKKCHWKDHKNAGYYLETEIVPVEKAYADKLEKYEKATGMQLTQKNLLEMMRAEYTQIQFDVEQYVGKCRDILQRLRQIALKPDPLSEVEYIDMLIQAERDEHKTGYEARINELQEIKAKAQRLKDVHDYKDVLPSH